jgi:hypothetical protein
MCQVRACVRVRCAAWLQFWKSGRGRLWKCMCLCLHCVSHMQRQQVAWVRACSSVCVRPSVGILHTCTGLSSMLGGCPCLCVFGTVSGLQESVHNFC